MRVSCWGERSAVGSLNHDRVKIRAARRAALLRACAIAGLLGQPALAAAPLLPQPSRPIARGSAAQNGESIFPLVPEKPSLSAFPGARGAVQPQIVPPMVAPQL